MQLTPESRDAAKRLGETDGALNRRRCVAPSRKHCNDLSGVCRCSVTASVLSAPAGIRIPESTEQWPSKRAITITVDEETHRRACAEAEQRALTVSELAAQAMAASLPHQDVDADHSRDPVDRELRYRRFLETIERIRADNPGFSAADNLPRDELYSDRDFWRRRGLD